ncbi:MAG: hypothetical protein M1817_003711 [Caeruleum heppii]|nr:MAG: hypothetical protein M1817_003711 [Caeruleum heppii]
MPDTNVTDQGPVSVRDVGSFDNLEPLVGPVLFGLPSTDYISAWTPAQVFQSSARHDPIRPDDTLMARPSYLTWRSDSLYVTFLVLVTATFAAVTPVDTHQKRIVDPYRYPSGPKIGHFVEYITLSGSTTVASLGFSVSQQSAWAQRFNRGGPLRADTNVTLFQYLPQGDDLTAAMTLIDLDYPTPLVASNCIRCAPGYGTSLGPDDPSWYNMCGLFNREWRKVVSDEGNSGERVFGLRFYGAQRDGTPTCSMVYLEILSLLSPDTKRSLERHCLASLSDLQIRCGCNDDMAGGNKVILDGDSAFRFGLEVQGPTCVN